MAAPEESPSASVQILRPAHDPTTILVHFAGRIDRDHARRLADQIRQLLDAGPADLVICDLAGITNPDAAVVDALCRIRVAARQYGCRVSLQAPAAELQELLYLTGLTDVLPVERGRGETASDDPPGREDSRVRRQRESE